MPLNRIIKRLKFIIALETATIIFLASYLIILLHTTPADVYKKVDTLEAYLISAVASYRSDMGSAKEDIKKLKEELRNESENLRAANERLIHLDPTFKPPSQE